MIAQEKMEKSLFKKVATFLLVICMIVGVVGVLTSMNANAATATEYTITGTKITNDYLVATANSGKLALYTTGGNPESSTDDNARLLYGSLDSGTSKTIINIDGAINAFSGTTYITSEADSLYSSNTYSGVKVEFYMSFVYNTYTARCDTVEYKYVFTNTSDVAKSAGARIFFDTMLGSNDSAPFRISGQNVTTHTEFTGDSIPQVWQVFDSYTNSTVVASGTFYNDISERPDKVQFLNYSNGYSEIWNCSGSGSIGDSAVNVYFNPTTLQPGEKKTVKTYYGISEFTPTPDDDDDEPVLPEYVDLDITAIAPRELLANDDNTVYLGNPFTFNGGIQNNGNITAQNAVAVITLPEGLSVDNDTINLGNISAGGNATAYWQITASPRTTAATLQYSVTYYADGVEAETVNYTIYVPALIHNHAYEEVEHVDPTCEDNGYVRYECECGATRFEIIDAYGHNLETTIEAEVTCTSDGLIVDKCINDGCDYEKRTVIHGSHDYQITDRQEATCNTSGYIEYTCSNCGEENYEYFDGMHNYVESSRVEPQVEIDGSVTYTCTACGDSYSIVIPALVPVLKNSAVLLIQDTLPWAENVNTTLLETLKDRGVVSSYNIINSSALASFDISQYGVVFIANDQTTAMYNRLAENAEKLESYVRAGGNLIYGACDEGWGGSGSLTHALPGGVETSNYYSVHNYIVNEFHPIVTGVYTDNRSLRDELLKGNYCSHTYFDKTTLVEGTNIILRDANGNPTLIEYSLGDGTVMASGLTWEYFYVRNHYGMSTNYSKYVYDDLLTYMVYMSNTCEHNYEIAETVDATCEANGYTKYVCANCSHEYMSDIVIAQGHSWTETSRTNATCIVDGEVISECTLCGETKEDVLIAHGHNYVNGVCSYCGYGTLIVDTWDGDIDISWYEDTDTEFTIYTAEQLAGFAQLVNGGKTFSGKTVNLASNIDLAGYEWTPIGGAQNTSDAWNNQPNFRGTFNGNYFVVRNVRISQLQTYTGGLFGSIYGAHILNLGVENVDYEITIYGRVGGLCGIMYDSKVENCYVTGNIELYNFATAGGAFGVGGLVGDMQRDNEIKNCYANCTIDSRNTDTGHLFVGGLVGFVCSEGDKTISNSYTNSTINTNGVNACGVGGIVGELWYGKLSIVDCFSTATLNGGYSKMVIGYEDRNYSATLIVQNTYYDMRGTYYHGGTATAGSNFTSESWLTTNVGWDFDTVWEFRAGSEYPVLQGFGAGLHVHDYEEISRIEATCTTYGEVVYTCVCGETKRELLEPTQHDYVITETIDATCTADGYIYFECQNDGCDATKRQNIERLGHNYNGDNVCDRCGHTVEIHTHDYTVEIIAPTCTAMGYTEYTCSCGYSYRDSYVEPTRHAWDDGVETVEKTCTTDGVITFTCQNCSATKTMVVEAGHEWSEVIERDKTCTIDGSKTKTCLVCGIEETEIIPASHEWNEGVITVAPTCDTEGKKICTCDDCGVTREFTIPALGHTYEDGVCTRCGERFIDNIIPSVHPIYGMYFEIDDILSDYGPSLIDEYGLMLDYNSDANLEKVAVYLTQDGTMWRRCIAVKGTNIEYATYVPYLSYNSEIKYTGLNHDWINIFRLSENSSGIWCYSNYATIGVNLQDAYGNLLLSLYDIGQAGAETRIFDDLDEMKAWLMECTHEESDWIVGTQPTCVEGMRYKKCTLCDEVLEREVIPPVSDHIASEWIIDVEPTATQMGIKHKECLICHTTLETDSISVIANVVIDSVNAKANSTVRVTIDVQNNPGIIGAVLTLDYDSALTLIGAEAGSAWSSLTLTCPQEFANPCNFVWDGVAGADYSNGTIIVLTFKVPEDANVGDFYYVNASYTRGNMIGADLSELDMAIENGSITVVSAMGDVNDDGIVDVADVITLRRYLAGGYNVTIDVVASDINGDGNITVGDIVLLRRMLVDYADNDTVTNIFVEYEQGGDVIYTNTLLSEIRNKIVVKAEYLDGTIEVVTNYTLSGLLIEGESTLTVRYNDLSTEFIVNVTEAPHVHLVAKIDRKEATCTEDGNIEYWYCVDCGEYFADEGATDAISLSDTVISASHIILHVDAKEPTCTEIGWNEYETCSRCDYTTYVEIDALGHDYIGHEAKEPTCAEIGWYAYDTCTRCDYTTYVEIEALDHDYVSHDAKEPTCTEIGWNAYETCSRCDYTTYVEIEAHDHDYVSHDAQDPTCTEIGWYEYETCARCDYTTYVEIGALGHDYIGHEAKEPTCTEIGWNAYDTCSRCDYTTYVEIEALGHNYVDGVCECGKEYYTEGLVFNLINNDTEYEVSGYIYTDTDSDVVIPSTYEGKSVTSIGYQAFYNCTSLTSITIPDSVTSIGSYAFYNCTALTKVNYLGTIDQWVEIEFANNNANPLYYAKNLYINDVLVTDAVLTTATKISDYAFDDCTSLTSITIPDSVTSIGSYAFYNCTSLNKVNYLGTIDQWVEIDFGLSISNPLLYTKSLYINDVLVDDVVLTTATKISNGAFYGCDSLTSIIIPESVTSIGRYAFWHCKSLTSITIPDSVTSIGEMAFSCCASLESITFGDNSKLEGIGGSAFEDCDLLTSITIPDSVTHIGSGAFYECDSLTSIIIPDSVTSIHEYAFENCDILTIYCEAGSQPEGWNSDWNYSNCPVVWGYGAEEEYTEGLVFSLINNDTEYEVSGHNATSADVVIPSTYKGKSVTSIGAEAFVCFDSLSSVVIPDSVTSIGMNAFYGCINLTNITIPDSVTTIGDGVFQGCYALDTVTFGENSRLQSIGEYAFWYCDSLKTVTFGENSKIESIGIGAFSYCRLLEDIIIPNSVTSIGSDAFWNCDILTIYCEVESKPDGWADNWNPDGRPVVWGYGAGEEYTEGLVFSLINNDTEYEVSDYTGTDVDVVIPSTYEGKSVTAIGDGAFKKCIMIQSIIIPDSVTIIRAYAFEEQYDLERVVIGDGVTTIEEGAFYWCKGLVDITIGNNVTIIGTNAFACCGDALKTIVIPDSVVEIGTGAFATCYMLESVTIGSGVTTIGDSAFNGCTALDTLFFAENGALTTIGQYAFSGCCEITSITIPHSVTKICDFAFNNCTALTSIYIPDSVAIIGDDFVVGCDLITIYCEAESQPSGWSKYWNDSGYPVVWSANGADVQEYTVDFVIDGDTVVTCQVAEGGTVVPPVAEREGFELAGWRYSKLDEDFVELDPNHRSADWGYLPETDPEHFTNLDGNRAYVARWRWVGVEGDCSAPETMRVNITGYSKLSAKFDESASIATGEVAVMSFDVLENASASGWTSIGLTTINNTFWNLAFNGYTGDKIFLPYDNNGTVCEYNDMSNVTSSTDVYMFPSNVLQKGKSLLFVYKPYESDTNPGYYRAYWKNTGSDDDYVLVAGWENLNSAQAIAGNMPCLAANGGELTVALKNFNISIDADGDYTTTDDWTNMGMGVAENCNYLRSATNSTGYNAKRYVNINTNYVLASDYEYTFTDGAKTINTNTVLAGASTVNRNDYNVDEGEYLEMKFTITDSNVDLIEESLSYARGGVCLGLGLSHSGSANNSFSGIHGYGLTIGLEDGDDAVVLAEAGPAGNSGYNTCDTIEAVSYGVGMRTLLKPGTEIKVVIALDLSDDGVNSGYTQVYYKTIEMDDYALAAEMTGVGNTVAMSDKIVNAYPLVWMTSNYVDNDATKLTIAFSNYSVATYDADGNVTSEVVLANPSVGGNGGTTVITNPAN